MMDEKKIDKKNPIEPISPTNPIPIIDFETGQVAMEGCKCPDGQSYSMECCKMGPPPGDREA